jgi:hypothetical protein
VSAAWPLDWRVALRLGRVSNLPTVWTNVLAGSALAGGPPGLLLGAALLLAMSLAYVGGMWLNDAFDRELDARERPERPLPAGAISARAVFAGGFGLLAAALALLLGVALALGRPAPLLLGGLLCAVIVAYDYAHKGLWYAPLLMGLCRALVYWTSAAVASPAPPSAAWWGGVLLWAYVVGLTFAAAQENLLRLRSAWPLLLLAAPLLYAAPALPGGGALPWLCAALLFAWLGAALWLLMRPGRPDLRGGVTALIAGISILDGLLAALAGASAVALLCLAGVAPTRLAQRSIPGT